METESSLQNVLFLNINRTDKAVYINFTFSFNIIDNFNMFGEDLKTVCFTYPILSKMQMQMKHMKEANSCI
jgi:hypothetical protein